MANLADFMDQSFDDTAVSASTGVPEPVPPGDYTLMAESTEAALTKDQTGAMLKVTFSVVEGQYEGRKIFTQFNVRNKNMQAQQIGIGELKALCLACEIEYDAVKAESDMLLHKPFQARVGMEKEQINQTTSQPYPPRNRILKYFPAGASAPAANTAAVVPPAAAAPRPASAPQGGTPWRKTA